MTNGNGGMPLSHLGEALGDINKKEVAAHMSAAASFRRAAGEGLTEERRALKATYKQS